jgi:adenylosuccinate synthase
VASGACSGSGVGPTAIKEVIGIAKAYTTRVGSGPFPTELNDANGEYLRKQGKEFGATTGRPRRCGWLDLEVLKHSKRVNSLTGIVITKLDVLTGIDKIKVCTNYDSSGRPVYKEFEGWKEDLSAAKKIEDLPKAARAYVDFIKKSLDVDICLVSVGPERTNNILLQNPFK